MQPHIFGCFGTYTFVLETMVSDIYRKVCQISEEICCKAGFYTSVIALKNLRGAFCWKTGVTNFLETANKSWRSLNFLQGLEFVFLFLNIVKFK